MKNRAKEFDEHPIAFLFSAIVIGLFIGFVTVFIGT